MFVPPEFEVWDGYRVRWVTDATWDVFPTELRSGAIHGIGINPSRGLHKTWREIQDATHGIHMSLLALPFCDQLGVDRIDQNILEGLKYALIGDFSGPAVYSSSTLETLRVRCDKAARFESMPALRSIYIASPTEDHLSQIARAAPTIEVLEIVDSRIKSIAGIAPLKHVMSCTLSYLPRAESVAPLSTFTSMRFLQLEKSKQLGGLAEVIPKLQKLEALRFFGMGDIGNADYICELQHLKELKILNTKCVMSEQLKALKSRVPTCLLQ